MNNQRRWFLPLALFAGLTACTGTEDPSETPDLSPTGETESPSATPTSATPTPTSATPTQAPDVDGDGLSDGNDNCPDIDNSAQADLDQDGIGDLCDEDVDGDGYLPENPLPSQVDCDDRDAQVHPAAVEDSCSGADTNCDGTVAFCFPPDEGAQQLQVESCIGPMTFTIAPHTVQDLEHCTTYRDDGTLLCRVELTCSPLNDDAEVQSSLRAQHELLSPALQLEPSLQFSSPAEVSWPYQYAESASLLSSAHASAYVDWLTLLQLDELTGEVRETLPASSAGVDQVVFAHDHFSTWQVGTLSRTFEFEPVYQSSDIFPGGDARVVLSPTGNASREWRFTQNTVEVIGRQSDFRAIPYCVFETSSGTYTANNCLSTTFDGSGSSGDPYLVKVQRNPIVNATRIEHLVYVMGTAALSAPYETYCSSDAIRFAIQNAPARSNGSSAGFVPCNNGGSGVVAQNDPSSSHQCLDLVGDQRPELFNCLDLEVCTPSIFYRDGDGDGYGALGQTYSGCTQPLGYVTQAGDCDDTDAQRYPGQTEECDGVDDNCDGQIDNGITYRNYYRDQDEDGYGDPQVIEYACRLPSGYVYNDEDCNDQSASISPAIAEQCDGIDQDCDGQVDEDVAGAPDWYPDVDEDGEGAANSTPVYACAAPEGYVSDDDDCDDSHSDVYPGAQELCDGLDNDCDESVDEPEDLVQLSWYPDVDQDGFGDRSATPTLSCAAISGAVTNHTDCDDRQRTTYPGAPEFCDQLDNDCDGVVDDSVTTLTWYEDQDGDGYGDATGATVTDCKPVAGYVNNSLDCNDADDEIYPTALERCDQLDNDCDGVIDDFSAQTFEIYWADLDGDGYGAGPEVLDCVQPSGLVKNGADCNDADDEIHPQAQEICDGEVDNDCDTLADDADADTLDSTRMSWYLDQDTDGYGVTGNTIRRCNGEAPYLALQGADCDDGDRTVYPAAAELCDQQDNDCDTQVDEGITFVSWYPDVDQDGYGDQNAGQLDCKAPQVGWTTQGGDCRDDRDDIKPGAPEFCDGIDSDCDEILDEGYVTRYFRDQDGDGFGDPKRPSCVAASGHVPVRGDCDDTRPEIHPGASDPTDSIDQDCGGTTKADPHVGYGTGSNTKLATAISSAVNGQTIWVNAGTYLEYNLSFSGKKITLISSHFEDQTIVDAQNKGRGFSFGSLDTSEAVLDGFTFQNNSNAIYSISSSPNLRRIRALTSSGNAIHIEGGKPTLSYIYVRDAAGSGIYTYNSSPMIRYSQLLRNRTGIWVYRGSFSMEHSLVMGNTGNYPDYTGIYIIEGSGSVSNSIVAYNPGLNISLRSSALAISYSNIYNPLGAAYVTTDTTNILTEPGFVSYRHRASIEDATLYLGPQSNLRNAGNTAEVDPDGTRADIGPFGGPEAEAAYYIDGEADGTGDGLYDGWERQHGLNPSALDDAADPDGDGVSNQEELKRQLLPKSADTDLDGTSDGAELSAGSNPLDWYEQPGETYPVEAQVPGDFATLQAAVDAIISPRAGDSIIRQGAIALAPMSVGGHSVVAYQKVMRISGAGAAQTMLDGSSIRVYHSTLKLSDLSLSGSSASGVACLNTSVCTITGVDSDMHAAHGFNLQGGTQATLTDVSASNNGGSGIYVYSTVTATLDEVLLSANKATVGGGLYISMTSTVNMTDFFIGDHSNTRGGGIALERTTREISTLYGEGVLKAERGSIVNNVSSSHGGGVYVYYGNLSFIDVLFERNVSGTHGGAYHTQIATSSFTDCDFQENSSVTSGGALYQYSGGTTLTRGTFLQNTSALGGALRVNAGSMNLQTGNVFEENVATQDGGAVALNDGNFSSTVGSLFYQNSATGRGGAIHLFNASGNLLWGSFIENQARDAGAIYFLKSTLTLKNGRFVQNTAEYDGGAILMNESGTSTQTLSNLRFEGGRARKGGAMRLYLSNPNLSNLLFLNNQASEQGGALYIDNASPVLKHLVMVRNQAGQGGAVLLGVGAKPTASELIVAYNTPDNLRLEDTAAPTLTFSVLYNPASYTNHNLSSPASTLYTSEPAFLRYADVTSGATCSPGNHMSCLPTDYHLASGGFSVGKGTTGSKDVDNSTLDLGIYGGSLGDDWNLDYDKVVDWFWPGPISTPPSGYSPLNYDCNDLSASLQSGC